MAKAEIGSTGLAEFSGQIADDFLRELRGKEGYKRFDEMRRNSPVIHAMLTAIEQSVRKCEWEFASDDEGDPRVELLNEARENMSHSWNDHISEALTMLPFGFSVFEIVYERDDRNRWLWRKFAPRGQDTVYQWKFDEDGGLAGFTQMAAPQYKTITLPIEKLILYRTRVERNNPEGRSILRSAWIPYYYAKHIQQIEAIGIERDLAGLPKIKLPTGASTDLNNSNSDASIAAKLVRNIRNDEQAGIVLPDGWELELLSSGGGKSFDTNTVINRYENRMLMAALAQFIMLGQEGVGSLALSKDQTDFFTMSVNAVADIIAETFTKFAIPRLLKLNGYDSEGVRLEHTPAGDTDVAAMAGLLQQIGSYLHWGAEDEVWLRQLVGLPERDPREIQAEIDEDKAQAATIKESITAGEDSSSGNKEETPEDKMTALLYAARPMDDRKRTEIERKLQAVIEAHLAKTKRKVTAYARELKRG